MDQANIPAQLLGEARQSDAGPLLKQSREIPGSFYYIHTDDGEHEDFGIVFSCPCGCKRRGFANLRPLKGQPKPTLWRNSGSREKPTLDNEIEIKAQVLDGWGLPLRNKWLDHWRGRLRDGVWINE